MSPETVAANVIIIIIIIRPITLLITLRTSTTRFPTAEATTSSIPRKSTILDTIVMEGITTATLIIETTNRVVIATQTIIAGDIAARQETAVVQLHRSDIVAVVAIKTIVAMITTWIVEMSMVLLFTTAATVSPMTPTVQLVVAMAAI